MRSGWHVYWDASMITGPQRATGLRPALVAASENMLRGLSGIGVTVAQATGALERSFREAGWLR